MKYKQTGHINKPVRGFTTITAAMAWCIKVNRHIILKIESEQVHKLPDHHNQYGNAWWIDENVKEWKCEFSVERKNYEKYNSK